MQYAVSVSDSQTNHPLHRLFSDSVKPIRAVFVNECGEQHFITRWILEDNSVIENKVVFG